MKALFLGIGLFSSLQFAFAGDIKWEGNYRFEAVKVFDPSLAGKNNKGYMLHHLTLKPSITAYDGLTIHSRFDILNNKSFPNDQLGQTFGVGVNPTPGTAGNTMTDSNTISDQQPGELIRVNEIYANWVHEFGVLTVGRAPMQFGLGMTFNGGYGMFDHWLENRDMIAYKLVMGNFSAMPVIAKTYEGILSEEDDVNDYILQLGYENPETELEAGFIYQARRSTANANSNDTPPLAVGAATGTLMGNYEVDNYNVFISQWVEQVKIAFEIGFASGNTGIRNAGGTEIKQDGFGGTIKVSWNPETSKWGAFFDLGFASGDDPNTPNTYEGYIFDQNYDVAFILFNHPVGSADFFRTSYIRNTSANPAAAFDTEAISNAMFASGAALYKWTDKFNIETRLTYAQLNSDPLQTKVDTSLGFELDLSLKYVPFKGFQWINRAGMLFPGAAFEGGTNNFPVNNSFGFETKAAISF